MPRPMADHVGHATISAVLREAEREDEVDMELERSYGRTVAQLDADTVHMRDSRRTASASRWTLDAARFSRR